jgi:hypothetical protein
MPIGTLVQPRLGFSKILSPGLLGMPALLSQRKPASVGIVPATWTPVHMP